MAIAITDKNFSGKR